MLRSLNLAPSFQLANAHSWIAGETNDATIEGAAPLTRDKVDFQNGLTALPLVTFQAGETVIASGSKTGRLLILRKGTVAILKENTEIARVGEPGAIFGELSLLLDQPHTADVRAVETSRLHVANATTLLSHIRSRSVMLPRCWRTGSMRPTAPFFNFGAKFRPASRTARLPRR